MPKLGLRLGQPPPDLKDIAHRLRLVKPDLGGDVRERARRGRDLGRGGRDGFGGLYFGGAGKLRLSAFLVVTIVGLPHPLLEKFILPPALALAADFLLIGDLAARPRVGVVIVAGQLPPREPAFPFAFRLQGAARIGLLCHRPVLFLLRRLEVTLFFGRVKIAAFRMLRPAEALALCVVLR